MVEEAWTWLTTKENREVVAFVFASIGSIWAAWRFALPLIQWTWRFVLRHPRALHSLFSNIWHVAHIQWGCMRLRLALLHATPEALLRLSKAAHDRPDAYSLALATAHFGDIEEAKTLNLPGAATGVALKEGPRAGLALLPRESMDLATRMLHASLIQLIEAKDDTEIRDFLRLKVRVAPLGEIAERLAKDFPALLMPPELEDLTHFLQSKPLIEGGWVPVKDDSLLQPINKRRLKTLRMLAARHAACKSLPSIAVNLALLAQAVVEMGEVDGLHPERGSLTAETA